MRCRSNRMRSSPRRRRRCICSSSGCATRSARSMPTSPVSASTTRPSMPFGGISSPNLRGLMDYVPGHGLLDGKRVLVTAAAGTGIGSATANRCIEEGGRVMISDAHERRLGETAGELQVPSLVCDVTDEEHVQQLFEAAVAELGGIDILV